MKSVPPFPPLGDPAAWDVLTLLAATVFLEAAGEPIEGKNGVAWVIRNRVDGWKQTFHQVILGPDAKAYVAGKPYEPFSCWNADYKTQAAKRLATADGSEVEACWRAATGVLWRLLPDPVEGANFYLNIEVTRKIRGGTLPSWFNKDKIVGTIGRHTFLRV